MARSQTQKERINFLTDKAIRFFDSYGDELESISQVLKIRLGGLASAYTAENKLPREAVIVHSRVKSLTSFLRKLGKTNWPMFGHPTKVITNSMHPSFDGTMSSQKLIGIVWCPGRYPFNVIGWRLFPSNRERDKK